jgi:hypothetical protein
MFIVLYYFVVFAFCSFLGCIKPVSFCYLCSDDEDPKRYATTAPSAEDINAGEPPMPEVEPAVKSLKASRAPIKKIPVSRSTKRSKKSKETDVSPEAHESADSPDDVSVYPSLCFLRYPHTHEFPP